jgi:hypothetical protein
MTRRNDEQLRLAGLMARVKPTLNQPPVLLGWSEGMPSEFTRFLFSPVFLAIRPDVDNYKVEAVAIRPRIGEANSSPELPVRGREFIVVDKRRVNHGNSFADNSQRWVRCDSIPGAIASVPPKHLIPKPALDGESPAVVANCHRF